MVIRISALEPIINQFEWDHFHISTGTAGCIPERLCGLVSSTTEKDVLHWYWSLENFIVVQGYVFDAALPSIEVLLVALQACDLAFFARVFTYELIFQIVGGYADITTTDHGTVSIVDQCKALVAQRLSVLIDQSTPSTNELLGFIREAIA